MTTRRDLIGQPKLLAAGGAAFAGGLLPYLYLPIRSRQDPVLDWGNPETLSALVDVVTRRDFWERRFLESPADLVPITADFVGGFGREIGLGGALLALLGVAAAMRTTRRRLIVLPALVVLGNLAALALHGSRSDIFIWHRYAIPSYLMLAWVAGWGAALVMARLPARTGLLLLAVPAVMLVRGFPDQDRSRYRIAEDFSRTLLEGLPPGAHLAASDDNILFVLMYLHLVVDVRPDVHLILQGVGGSLPPLRFDPDSDPLFFTEHPNWNHPQLEILPAGLAFRVWRRERPAPSVTVPKERLEGELDARVPKDDLTQNLIGQFHYMRANTLERSDWPRARREYAEAMKAAPHNDVLFFNLGLIFGGSGLYDEAIAAFRRSSEINPRPVPGPGRLKASDRVAPLERERRRIAALEADLVADHGLTGMVPRSPEWHRRMAELLRMRGEPAAARGHELRALEADARR